MKRTISTIISVLYFCTAAMAQIEYGQSSTVTLFREYKPAVLTLVSGRPNHQREANIFLKNSAFLYKQGKNVMEADMQMIKTVKFGERTFINLNNKLAEVVDSCGDNLLLHVRIINQEGLKHELLNSSTISNISTGDLLSVTRVEESSENINYPLNDIYYVRINGKATTCDEREIKRIVGKRRMEKYNLIINDPFFRWYDEGSLKKILELLSE